MLRSAAPRQTPFRTCSNTCSRKTSFITVSYRNLSADFRYRATLHELDEDALVRILLEPKNALVKQYKKLFGFEHVKLRFTDEALQAVAAEALKRKTGARGLRSILEAAMLDIMYELPEFKNLQEVIVNEEVIFNNAECILVFEKEAETAS